MAFCGLMCQQWRQGRMGRGYQRTGSSAWGELTGWQEGSSAWGELSGWQEGNGVWQTGLVRLMCVGKRDTGTVRVHI
jgi:hypothetical protein